MWEQLRGLRGKRWWWREVQAAVMAATRAGGAERLRGWRGVARRCGERARTARAHGSGVEERRRREGKAAAARDGRDAGDTERKEKPTAGKRDI